MVRLTLIGDIMEEEWVDVKFKLPEIGQRVRALVVKELIYKGGLEWTYDSRGEHGIYSWSEKIKDEDEFDRMRR